MHELPELPELPILAAFSPYVGQVFHLAGEGVELELVEAEALPAHEGAPRQDPFSLLFRGPAGCSLPQGTYTLSHKEVGDVPMFLVPVGQSGQRVLFQAIFN